MEDRPGAGGGQLGGTQAFGEIAAERAALCRAGGRSGSARGRVQRGAGQRQGRGRTAGAAHGRGRAGVHWFYRRGQAAAAVRRPVQHETRLHGMRRQEPEHRVRRRAESGQGGRSGCQRHLLQPGRSLHGGVAVAGGAFDQGRVRREGHRARSPYAAKASLRAGRTDGCPGGRSAGCARAGLHRRRHGRRRASTAGWKACRRGGWRLLHRADRIR
ncbi:hypothetical protein D3C71_1444020 [compost metagenome]